MITNELNGNYTLKWFDRDYSGEVKNNQAHGIGIAHWPDGSGFVGKWKEGMPYEGEFTAVLLLQEGKQVTKDFSTLNLKVVADSACKIKKFINSNFITGDDQLAETVILVPTAFNTTTSSQPIANEEPLREEEMRDATPDISISQSSTTEEIHEEAGWKEVRGKIYYIDRLLNKIPHAHLQKASEKFSDAVYYFNLHLKDAADLMGISQQTLSNYWHDATGTGWPGTELSSKETDVLLSKLDKYKEVLQKKKPRIYYKRKAQPKVKGPLKKPRLGVKHYINVLLQDIPLDKLDEFKKDKRYMPWMKKYYHLPQKVAARLLGYSSQALSNLWKKCDPECQWDWPSDKYKILYTRKQTDDIKNEINSLDTVIQEALNKFLQSRS